MFCGLQLNLSLIVNSMHIFITGIAGFLGANLADYYISKGYEVSGCDNLVGGTLDNLDNKEIKFYKANCENLEEIKPIMKNVDVVIHAAAYPHEGLSSFSPFLICKSNFIGSVSVFTASVQNNVKRIVFCSSMARYGDVNPPFTEDQKVSPVDPYGVSKLAAEDVLKIMSKTHGFEYNIAVPHNIIGPKQKYDDPFRNVVSIMTNLILQDRRPIIYGDGKQTRNFSDIDDDFISIHHWLKYYKFGFTRLFDNLSLEIRNKRITRLKALNIIKKETFRPPLNDIKKFCKFVNISINEFFKISEKFRNKDIWLKKNGKWKIKNFIV